MGYKDIIKSRKTRIKIMQFLSFVPDKWMIQLQYRIKTGRKLDLKNPKRFTEKLQWYKLYYRDPLMAKCSDKYEVRKYVEACGLGHILNELYGVYDSAEEVNFDKLPNSFVIKDTLGGGGNSVILVPDKSQMDEVQIRQQMQEWVNEPTNKKSPGREWVYDGRKHRIIIEKYIESNPENGGLIDYKFFCFNGKAECLYVIADRDLGGEAQFGIYDVNFKNLGVTRVEEKALMREIEKPANYKELLQIAEKLSLSFPHARIDMYDVDDQVKFGEITFFSGSGYIKYNPDEFDYRLGDKFNLVI